MAACLVSPLSWMYSFLLIHTFCLRNSSSSAFLVSSVVSTTFFDFLVVECTRSNVIFFLMLLRNVLLMRRCTFWNWTDSERIFFFSSSVSRRHFSEVLKNPSSPSSTMFPLASRSQSSSMQASSAAPITFLGRCWNVETCSTNSFWYKSLSGRYVHGVISCLLSRRAKAFRKGRNTRS